MEMQDKIIAKLVEMDSYMREHMATKNELQAVKVELTDKIEGFIELHETVDYWMVALRSKVERLGERLDRLETAFKAG